MSNVQELYSLIHDGLEMTAGPKDARFTEVWEIYTDVTHLAGTRLMESRMGGSLEGADEVRLFVERFGRVAKISRGMPLQVPATAVRGFRAMGRLLESTKEVEELGEYLRLTSPITNDLSEYARTHLGRYSDPIVKSLTIVARSASIMNDCLVRAVPALIEWEENR